ncbi:hypothetical protein AAHA92_04302 [Salvia divinorum]
MKGGGGGGARMMSTTTTTIATEPWKLSSPWLMLRPSSEAYKLYSLAENKVVSIKKEAPPPPWAQGRVVHVGSSHGWVASFNRDNQQTFLSDPITGRHIKLPDTTTLSESPSRRIWPHHILLSSSPSDRDCHAIMSYGRIAICSPGHATTNWLPAFGHGSYYELAYFARQNRLFCLANYPDSSSDLVLDCWDLESPTFVWKVPLSSLSDDDDNDDDEEDKDTDNEMRCGYPKYLVMDESSCRLFLVIRYVLHEVGRDGSFVKSTCLKCGRGDYSYPHKTVSFEVYEIDGKDGKMRYMDGSLDGLAIFVGSNHSFALPAADLNLRPDSIYSPEMVKMVSMIAPAMWFTPIPH